MKNKTILIFALCVLFSSQSLFAQDRFAIELRGAAAFSLENLGDAELKTGFGIEGILDYRFMSHLGVYVGWGWNRFPADESFAGNEVDFTETGYVFGLQFNHPIGESPFAYYVRAGGLYNHIEIENNAGDIIYDSGHGMGWQLGLGFDISLGSGWQIKPGVKYQSLARDFDFESTSTAVNLDYISVGVGIAKKF